MRYYIYASKLHSSAMTLHDSNNKIVLLLSIWQRIFLSLMIFLWNVLVKRKVTNALLDLVTRVHINDVEIKPLVYK